MFDLSDYPPHVELMRISAFDWGTLFGAMARIVDEDDQRLSGGGQPVLRDDERQLLIANCNALRQGFAACGLDDLSEEYERRMVKDNHSPASAHDAIEPLFVKIPISLAHLLSGLVVVFRHYKHFSDWTMDAIAHTLNNAVADVLEHIKARNAFRGVEIPNGVPEEFD